MAQHDNDIDERGVNKERKASSSWHGDDWRGLACELVSTGLLLALGCWSLLPKGEAPLSHAAQGFGFAVVGLASAFPSHMNPALTLASAISGHTAWPRAALIVMSQCVGACVGFAPVWFTVSSASEVCACCTTFPASVSWLQALAVEALATACLALVCCQVWASHDPQRPDFAAPLKIGLVVAGLVYSAGSLTGASLNPARSLAPAIFNQCWTGHWVYWVGPLAGGALASLFHLHVVSSSPRKSLNGGDRVRNSSSHIQEQVPLHQHKATNEIP